MKQVIVYNQIDSDYHGGRCENETLFRYFRSQIDWSLSLGWKKDDIIIGTNFSFEYNGVKNHNLTDICTYSGFNNFWYGALELIKNGVLTEDFWLHDQDSGQLEILVPIFLVLWMSCGIKVLNNGIVLVST